MLFYLNLAGTGLAWIFMTWLVCKYHTDENLSTDPVRKKLYPIAMTCMVLLGSLFVYKVTHIGELT